MTLHSLSRLLRPAALLLLIAGIFLLGTHSPVWATPAQAPYGQTVPTKTPKPTQAPEPTLTPKPTKAPEPTKTPKPTKAPEPTKTAKPTEALEPTKTPKPTKTPDESAGSCSALSRAPVSRDTEITLEACPWLVVADGAAFTVDGTLQLQLAAADAVPRPNAGDTFIGTQADVTLFDSDGNPIAQPALTRSIEVCYRYTDAETAQAAGDPANFTLQSFSASSRAWTDLATSVDASNSRVCASPTHLSLFALATRLRPSMLPKTAASSGPAASMWFIAVIALALGLGLALRSGWLGHKVHM